MEHSSGIPIVVLYQAINVTTLLVILFFVLRKQVVAGLQGRKDTHDAKVKTARQAVEEAEQKNTEIKSKIENIEATRNQSLEEAKKNAEELRQKMVRDGQAQAEQLKLDAQRTVQFEFEKAKNDLRAEILEEILATSQTTIAKNATDKKLEALNQEFIDGVRVQ